MSALDGVEVNAFMDLKFMVKEATYTRWQCIHNVQKYDKKLSTLAIWLQLVFVQQ